MISKLVAFGATRSGIPQLASSVLDLSTLMDKDLGRATLAMSRALKGEFGAFTELGFKIDETASAAENFRSILEQVAATAGGQATAQIKTLSGEIDQAQKAWKDFKKEFGEAVSPAVSAVATIVGAVNTLRHDIRKEPELIEEIKKQRAAYDEMVDSLRKVIIERVKLNQ